MLISSYISKLEDKQQKQVEKVQDNKNYIRLKKYAYLSTFIIIIQTLLLVIH